MTPELDARTLAEEIAALLDKKKAKQVKILKVTEKTVIADYFVIAGGTSSTQVKALADEVEYQIGVDKNIKPVNVEGRGTGGWILLDYENVIMHVFDPKMREVYNLEKLWAECEEVPFERIED